MGSLRSLRSKVDEPVIVYPSDEEVIQAVENNNLKELEALLKKGGNPNAEEVFHWCTSALSIAIIQNRVKLVHLLVRHGANVRHSNISGYTPLHRAVVAGWKAAQEMTPFLLTTTQVNAVDDMKSTALMEVVYHKKNVEVVKILLERGADPTMVDSFGDRAVDLIGRRGKYREALKALLEPIS